MSRIKSDNVNFGERLVIGDDEIKARKRREEENDRIEKLMALNVQLQNASEKADIVVQKAQNKAAEIIQQAEEKKLQIEAEIEQMKQDAINEGFKTGHDDGYQEGFAKITEEMLEKINSVDIFAGANFEIKNKILSSSKSDMLNLCFEICKKVCAKSLDAEVLERIIRESLAMLESKTVVNVMISPKLADKLEPDFDKNFKNVRIVQNPKIADDSIIIESLSGNLDCSISAQIEKIAGELLNVE